MLLAARRSIRKPWHSNARSVIRIFDGMPSRHSPLAVRPFTKGAALGADAEGQAPAMQTVSWEDLTGPVNPTKVFAYSDVKKTEKMVRTALKENKATPEMCYKLLESISESRALDMQVVTAIMPWFGKESPLPPSVLNDPKFWSSAIKVGLRLGSTFRQDDLRRILKAFTDTAMTSTLTKEHQDAFQLMVRGYGVLQDVQSVNACLTLAESIKGLSLLSPYFFQAATIAFADCREYAKVDEMVRKLDEMGELNEHVLLKIPRVYGFQGEIARTQAYNALLKERYPQRDGVTSILRAHKSALENTYKKLNDTFGVRALPLTSHSLSAQVDRIDESWRKLFDRLESSQKRLNLTQCNLALEYFSWANKVDPVRFPMKKAEDVIEKLMPRHGVTPNRITYTILQHGYALTKEYAHMPDNERLNKALRVLTTMKKGDFFTARSHTFHSLYFACLPRVHGYFPFDNFKLSSLISPRYLNGNASLDKRIFLIEQLMLEASVPHDRCTFKTLLTCLGTGGRYKDMWARWRMLKTLGLYRDGGLYQRVFALASLDPAQALYAMTVTKLEYEREPDRGQPSWDLYCAMLDCSVSAQLAPDTEELIARMRKDVPRHLANSAGMYDPLLRASLAVPGLAHQVPSLLEEMRNKGVEYRKSTWLSAISHLAITNAGPEKIQQVFNEFTMHQFQLKGRIPIPAREASPCVPFPSGPYSTLDMQIIDVYISSLLDTQDLSLVVDVVRTLHEQESTLLLSPRLMKGIVKLAIQENSNDELQWMISDVLPKAAHQNSSYRSWLDHLKTQYTTVS